MILAPFDASRRDESNDIWLDFVRSLYGRLFDFSHFYKNRIKPNRTASFSVQFLRISALIRTVYNPDQTDPFGALLVVIIFLICYQHKDVSLNYFLKNFELWL